MTFSEFQNTLTEAFRVNNIEHILTDSMTEKFYIFSDLLVSENRKYNLTAIENPRDIIYKHFTDSLLISSYIAPNSSLIDVGSGAGFPAIPLAIAREDLSVTALDSTGKKIAFIKMCADKLQLSNLDAILGRAEELGRDTLLRERFSYATARAVSSMPIISELCVPFLKVGGTFLAMKGVYSAVEVMSLYFDKLKCAGPDINRYRLIFSDGQFEDRTLISLRKLEKTPHNFPRNYAAIQKKPLS